MEKEKLKKLIAKGKLEAAISLLLEISNQFLLSFNKEIILLSARYNAIKSDKIKGIINNDEYNIASNSITNSLLEIIALIDELDISKIKKKSDSNISEKINKLNDEFEETRKIAATTSRLRMKGNIAKSIGDKFIQFPEIINQFIPTNSNGVICGFCIKIQATPEFGDLDKIELVFKNISSDFTKGCMTNALAELIYSQKLQLGDDKRIIQILNKLKENADNPLSKNIERVEAALNYLINGK